MEPIERFKILDKIEYATKDKEWLSDSIILLVRAGSMAHGTSTPESDVDVKGVAIPPLREFYYGNQNFNSLNHSTGDQHTKNTKDDIDVTIYSLKKFVSMATNANSNILEMLFVNEDDIILRSKYGQALINNRHLFLTNKIRKSFGGFAMQSAQRIQKKMEKDGAYDPYDLMHGVRLLKTATQAFIEGSFTTRRDDEELLLLSDIRSGAYSYDEALKLLEEIDKEFMNAYEQSVLPNEPNHKHIERLLISITEEYFHHEG